MYLIQYISGAFVSPMNYYVLIRERGEGSSEKEEKGRTLTFA